MTSSDKKKPLAPPPKTAGAKYALERAEKAIKWAGGPPPYKTTWMRGVPRQVR